MELLCIIDQLYASISQKTTFCRKKSYLDFCLIYNRLFFQNSAIKRAKVKNGHFGYFYLNFVCFDYLPTLMKIFPDKFRSKRSLESIEIISILSFQNDSKLVEKLLFLYSEL